MFPSCSRHGTQLLPSGLESSNSARHASSELDFCLPVCIALFKRPSQRIRWDKDMQAQRSRREQHRCCSMNCPLPRQQYTTMAARVKRLKLVKRLDWISVASSALAAMARVESLLICIEGLEDRDIHYICHVVNGIFCSSLPHRAAATTCLGKPA